MMALVKTNLDFSQPKWTVEKSKLNPVFLVTSSKQMSTAKPNTHLPSMKKKVGTCTKKKRRKKETKLEMLKGEKVLAWDKNDGLYYTGEVLNYKDRQHARVKLDNDDERKIVTEIRHLMPHEGSVARPNLQVGDYVLVNVQNLDMNTTCYVPGIVQHLSVHNTQNNLRGHTALLYNAETVTTIPKHMVKITNARFEFLCRTLLTKQEHDMSEFVLKKTLEYKRRYIQCELEKLRNGFHNKDKVLHSKSTPQVESQSCTEMDQSKSSLHESSMSEQESLVQAMQQTLASKSTPEMSVKPPKSARSRKSTSSSTRAKSRSSSTSSTSTLSSGLSSSSVSESESEESPPLKRKEQKAQKSPSDYVPSLEDGDVRGDYTSRLNEIEKKLAEQAQRQAQKEKELKEDLLFLKALQEETANKTETGTSTVPEIRVEVIPDIAQYVNGDTVLARWSHVGWYYYGQIASYSGEHRYIVQDRAGQAETIHKDDILEPYQRTEKLILADSVVALHPLYTHSYAPGLVLCVYHEDETVRVQFYDGAQDRIPADEVYKIHMDKFRADVEYIEECERGLIDKIVVVREEDTGRFYLGRVKEKPPHTSSYIIQWPDGTRSDQIAPYIYSDHLPRHVLHVSDYVLCPVDDKSTYYLPGYIVDKTNEQIRVQLCDTRTVETSADVCFWMSTEYYEDAVSYINSKTEIHRNMDID